MPAAERPPGSRRPGGAHLRPRRETDEADVLSPDGERPDGFRVRRGWGRCPVRWSLRGAAGARPGPWWRHRARGGAGWRSGSGRRGPRGRGDGLAARGAAGVALRGRGLHRGVARLLGPAPCGARRPAGARRLARGVEYRDGVLPGGAPRRLRARPPARAPRLAPGADRGARVPVGGDRSHRADRGAATPRRGAGRWRTARPVAARDPRGGARPRLRRRLVPHPARPELARAGGGGGRVRRSLLPLRGLERGLRRRPRRVPVPSRALPRARPAGVAVERGGPRARAAAPRPVAGRRGGGRR